MDPLITKSDLTRIVAAAIVLFTGCGPNFAPEDESSGPVSKPSESLCASTCGDQIVLSHQTLADLVVVRDGYCSGIVGTNKDLCGFYRTAAKRVERDVKALEKQCADAACGCDGAYGGLDAKRLAPFYAAVDSWEMTIPNGNTSVRSSCTSADKGVRVNCPKDRHSLKDAIDALAKSRSRLVYAACCGCAEPSKTYSGRRSRKKSGKILSTGASNIPDFQGHARPEQFRAYSVGCTR